MIGTGGKAPKVSAAHIVALYDPTNGRVVHLHQVVVFEGGKSVSQEEAQREAIEKARRRGHEVGRLKVLYVGDRLPSRGGHFRVDIASKRLIASEVPVRRRSKKQKAKAITTDSFPSAGGVAGKKKPRKKSKK